MRVDINNLPAEVMVAVPGAFRDYLKYWQTVKWTFLSLLYGAMLVGYYYQWRHGRVGIELLPHLLLLFLSTFVWLTSIHLYRDWHYKLDDRTIKLVCWQWRDKVWQWYKMEWRQDVVINVEPNEWRGLPALCLKVRMKNHKTPQDLWIVYAHEDQDTVQNIVLPLIEKYRKQYRHELWADILRQDKPHDISH